MPLVLDSLEIKNFRAFKHLRIEKLGRVNLIVGKNNVGKSSVLEALWLYARRGDPNLIWNVLRSRDESGTEISTVPPTESARINALRHLFYGRKVLQSHPPFVRISLSQAEENDIFFIGVVEPIAPTEGPDQIQGFSSFDEMEAFFDTDFSLIAGYGSQAIYHYPLAPNEPRVKQFKTEHQPHNCVSVLANGLSDTETSSLWDAVALTSLEEDVLFALSILAPNIERVNMIGSAEPLVRRNAIVKLRSDVAPIPLRSMGEGMNRMFGIALALVNAKDGMLLIDEVDTGLHYSVLPDLWKLIFEVAHRLNVQVFATSHSWDCIQAFQLAAEENKKEEGIVIRLEIQDGEVVPVTFDERKLSIATREQIEVR